MSAPPLRKRIRVNADASASEPKDESAPTPVQADKIKIKKRKTIVKTTNSELFSQSSKEEFDLSMVGERTYQQDLENLKLYEYTDTEVNKETVPSKTVGVRAAVKEEMEKRENEFKQHHVVKQNLKNPTSFVDVTKAFISNINDVTRQVKDHANAVKSLLEALDFSSVQVQGNYFNPELAGVSSIYKMDIDELYADITEKDDNASIQQMRKKLQAEYIDITGMHQPVDPDYIKQINDACDRAIDKYETGNYIDVSKNASFDLIFRIASLFYGAAKKSVIETIKQLSKVFTDISMTKPTLSSLSVTISEIATEIETFRGPDTVLATIATEKMIRSFSLSQFINFIGAQPNFKRIIFYNDSIFCSNEGYLKFAEAVERVESCTIIGQLRTDLIPENFVLSNASIISRIHGSVQDFTFIERANLLSSNEAVANRADEVFIIMARALLRQRDGSMAKTDLLWDILVASSAKQSPHPRFAEFDAIVRDARATGKNSKERISKAIIGIIERGLFPYLLLFAYPAYTMVKGLQSVSVLCDPITVIKISYELSKIQGIHLSSDHGPLLKCLGLAQ